MNTNHTQNLIIDILFLFEESKGREPVNLSEALHWARSMDLITPEECQQHYIAGMME